MEQQRNIRLSKIICNCDCNNCTFLRKVVRELLHHRKYEMNRLSNVEAVSFTLDHITEHESIYNTLLRMTTSSSDSSNTIMHHIIKMTKINLLEMVRSEIVRQMFTNEVMFYKTFARRFVTTICVKGYIFEIITSRKPVLILRDLTVDGYTQFETKLSKTSLTKCIKVLAWFHANAAKLMNENADFKSYSPQLEVKTHEKSNQLRAFRSFLNSSLLKTFGKNLQGKIKQKLKKVAEHLLVNRNNSILVHGSLTRSKIFFKEMGGTEAVKFINFQTVQLGSPAIDFGRLLFTNLPNECNVNSLEKFCKDILNHYMIMFMKIYPTYDSSRVHQNIINNLVYSYVNLDETEKKEIINHITLVTVLDNLGSLD